MNKKILLPALLLSLVLIGLYISLVLFKEAPTNRQNEATAPLTRLEHEITAPDFKLADLDGETHSLASYQGKPLIINFWATWCPPCRAELPSMNRAWQKIKDEGINMVAVNVGESEDTVFAFMGQYPIDFTVLLDETGEIINQWPIKGLPTTFVLNKEGKLVYRAIGGRAWDSDELLNMVRQLKSEPLQRRR